MTAEAATTARPPLGLTHPHFTAASSFSLALLVALFCLPPLHASVRALARPAVTRRVRSGLTVVSWLQARRTPGLTALFSAASATVSVPFYVAALPALQWCGSPALGARLSFALGVALYVGNALKDLVCAPRPLGLVAGSCEGGERRPARSSPRRPRRSASAPALHASSPVITSASSGPAGAAAEAVSAREYGLPSSHVMNTLVLAAYAAHYGLGHTAVGRGWVARTPVAAPLLAYGGAGLATAVVALARMYAGMHTPVDVLAGAAAGVAVFSAWTAFDEPHEAFLVAPGTTGVAVLATHALTSALLLRLHPRPLVHTPSYEASATFLGACTGVAGGVWRSRGQHLVSGGWASLPHARGAGAVAAAVALRLACGFGTAALVHVAAKATARTCVPFAYRAVPLALRRLWQPPLHSLMTDRKWTALRIPLDARGRPWDVSITTRFLSYAALGWGVSDGAFGVMGWAERRWWLTQP
jgi:membrane-associated phospholipid phosphatase